MKNFLSFLLILLLVNLSVAQTKALDSLMITGEFAKLIEMADASIESQSKKEAFLVAKAYIGLGNAKKASEVYQQNLEDGDDLRHFYSYGKVLLQQNQAKLADSIFSYLHEKNPNNAEFLYRSALAKQKLDSEDFKKTLYQAYDLQQNHLLVAYELAKEELKQKNYAIANRIATQALWNNPENTSLLSIKGQALYARGKWEECVSTFNQLKKVSDVPLFVELRLAKAHVKLGNYPDALKHYENCIAKDPTDFQILEDAAEVATFCEETKKAQIYISQAFALKDVSRSRQYYIFGTVFLQKEDFERAIGLFTQCIEEDANHEKATYALANAKDRFYADQQKILEAYELYLQNFPDGNYADLANYRVKELRKEIFLAGERLKEKRK
ncbi:tetratricopeptide repeat protein [Psychroflexus planctonicus]|nr:tetratricopeptide repeat protein [Psychroflexus planctonicus]